MKVIENEQLYMFDVDDTLVLWDEGCLKPGEGRIAIVDPYDGHTVYLKPHVQHKKLISQMKGRGRFIVVWSAGGCKWAEAVVKALGLEQYVDLVITKPLGYVDDLPISEWLPNRIYLSKDNA